MSKYARILAGVALASMAALTLSACGGPAPSSKYAPSPEGALTAFLTAADHGDYADACAYLSTAAVSDIATETKKPCGAGLPAALEWFDYTKAGIGSHMDASQWTTDVNTATDGTEAWVSLNVHTDGHVIDQKAAHSSSGWQVAKLEMQGR